MTDNHTRAAAELQKQLRARGVKARYVVQVRQAAWEASSVQVVHRPFKVAFTPEQVCEIAAVAEALGFVGQFGPIASAKPTDVHVVHLALPGEPLSPEERSQRMNAALNAFRPPTA